MNDIYEISQPSIQDDWRGIKMSAEVIYDCPLDCSKCFRNSACDNANINYTVVVFTLKNKNSFPIYTDFIDSIIAVDNRGAQHSSINNSFYECNVIFEKSAHIHSGSNLMPYAVQKRAALFDSSVRDIQKLEYRGKIYGRYEECNWGYLSYDMNTNELTTNGSLEYIARINEEHDRRKLERLLVKPQKLISELNVLIYKRNTLPQTYKEFAALTTKASGKLKELEELTNLNGLDFSDVIADFSKQLETTEPAPSKIFKEPGRVRIHTPEEELSPEEFEHYVAKEFAAAGYKTDVTRYSGDGGIDIIMYRDNKTYGVQCKMLSPDRFVDTTDMLCFLGALVNMRADGGFFVTTGKFTVSGTNIADNNGIRLIKI